MAKGKNDARPLKGGSTPLQPMVTGKNLKIDTRMEPCGDNKLVSKKENDRY